MSHLKSSIGDLKVEVTNIKKHGSNQSLRVNYIPKEILVIEEGCSSSDVRFTRMDGEYIIDAKLSIHLAEDGEKSLKIIGAVSTIV